MSVLFSALFLGRQRPCGLEAMNIC